MSVAFGPIITEDAPTPPGFRPMVTAFAMGAVGLVSQPGDAALTVADLDLRASPWPRFDRLFSELPEVKQTFAAPATAAEKALLDRLADATDADRADVLLELVRNQVAAVLGTESATDLDLGEDLLDLGFSSLAAMELSTRMRAVGLELSPQQVFDQPTIAGLAAALEPRRNSDAP